MTKKHILTKQEIAEREMEFQRLQDDYFTNHSESAWNQMWFYVKDACTNIAKKQLSVVTDDFEGKVMNAVCDCMNKVKNGERINKLSSFVYLYVYGRLFDRKVAKFEQCISLDEYLTTISEKENKRDKYNY